MGNVTISFLILLIFLCSMLFIVNKKHSVVPLIFSMCFLPADTPIIIFSLNFYPIRILGLCGLVKIFISDDFKVVVDELPAALNISDSSIDNGKLSKYSEEYSSCAKAIESLIAATNTEISIFQAKYDAAILTEAKEREKRDANSSLNTNASNVNNGKYKENNNLQMFKM